MHSVKGRSLRHASDDDRAIDGALAVVRAELPTRAAALDVS